jgi:hypothetical protein
MMPSMAAATTTPASSGVEEPTGSQPRDSATQAPREGEPTIEGAFAADGVDLTVIRWMLDRSPEERLQAVQQLIDAASVLRRDEA